MKRQLDTVSRFYGYTDVGIGMEVRLMRKHGCGSLLHPILHHKLLPVPVLMGEGCKYDSVS